MPKTLPKTIYYYLDYDTSIPSNLSQHNIVLSLHGMQEIANYYQEKYNIKIKAINSNMSQGPQEIFQMILEARKESSTSEVFRCGFIINNQQAGYHGHAMPMIWEKNKEKESLIFLDTGQYLGDTSYVGYSCDFLFMPSFEESSPTDALLGKSEYAYILTEKSLFYRDKANNKTRELLINRSLFSNEVSIDKLKLLAVTQHAAAVGLSASNPCISLSEKEILTMEKNTGARLTSRGRDSLQFRKNLKKLLPDLTLYSHLGARQLDSSSCTTDALVVLKDALQSKTLLADRAQQKLAQKTDDLILFYMPEELLKTAQIGSYPQQSHADVTKPIHLHHIKNAEGQHTGINEWHTLGFFRKKYDVLVPVKGENKFFGTFTLHKGERYKQIIDQRCQDQQALKNESKTQ